MFHSPTSSNPVWYTLSLKTFLEKYDSPNIITVIISRRMKWVRNVASRREMRIAYKVLVGKPDCKRPLGRPRCR
jgi:hypothetical protein